MSEPRTIENFFENGCFTEFEQKMFSTGICSDVCGKLDQVLSDEQKKEVIKEIDDVYSPEVQKAIKVKFLVELNKSMKEQNKFAAGVMDIFSKKGV